MSFGPRGKTVIIGGPHITLDPGAFDGACDVIQYPGRKQRHKTPEQVIAEVQRLYDLGCNRIALADDNFTVFRKRATAFAVLQDPVHRRRVGQHDHAATTDAGLDDRVLETGRGPVSLGCLQDPHHTRKLKGLPPFKNEARQVGPGRRVRLSGPGLARSPAH